MDLIPVKVSLLENGIFHILLDRPKQLNALNHEILSLLHHHLREIKFNNAIQAVMISGSGKSFCAGADIKEIGMLENKYALDFAKKGQAIFRELELLGKPSIAVINGAALGGGCELAMSCTLRIASPETVFGQPEINLGIIPGYGGTQRLPRLIGKTRALQLCLTGKFFSAQEALEWGFLNEVVAVDDLQQRAIDILKSITSKSSTAIAAILQTIHLGYDLSLEESLELEAVYFSACCNSKEKEEGINAFLEKRTPNFSASK